MSEHEKERLRAFVERVAKTELCEDANKEMECHLDSGPTCGAHGWYTDEYLVKEARALLAEIDEPPVIDTEIAAVLAETEGQ